MSNAVPIIIAPRRAVGPAAGTVAALLAVALSGAYAPLPVGAHPAAQTGKICTARYTRDFYRDGTRVAKVGWGNAVDVELRVEVDCPSTLAEQLEGFNVTESPPAGLTLEPLDDPMPATWSPSSARWRFAVDGEDLVGNPVRRFRYRLRVAPVDPPVTGAGEARFAWPLAVDATLRGKSQVLAPPLDVPLSVFISRPDADCQLQATRRFSPARVQPGETVEVTLTVTPHGCWAFPVRDNGMLVFQPPTALTPENVERSVTTARAWYDPPTGPIGIYGMVWNVAPPPVVVPPTRDLNALSAPIRRWNGEQGGSAADGLKAALGALVKQPVSHEIIYYIGNAGAPASAPGALSAALQLAAERGVEVVPICVGGGCDPELTWQYDYPDLQRLRDAVILNKITAFHRGPAAALTSLSLDESLPAGARFVAGSVVTSAPGGAVFDGAGLHIGPLPARIDQPITVRYRFVAPNLGAVRYAGDGTATLLYSDTFASARLRLPRAPLGVGAGASAGPACVPASAKSTWEPSIVLDQTVGVTVAFDTVCPRDARKQDLLIVVDASRTTSANELSAIRGAVRTLLFGLADTDVHAGLVTADWAIRRVPLSANLDRALDPLDALGTLAGAGFGEPNIAAALAAAADELSWRRADAHAGVVLISDGSDAPDRVLAAADALKADGVQVAAVCIDLFCDPLLARVASEPADFHAVAPGALDTLLAALARRYGSVRIASARLEETLPPDMAYVPGSAVPAPDGIDGQRLTWNVTARPGAAEEAVRYAVRPRVVGPAQPVGSRSTLAFTDEFGRASRADLASPPVTVFPRGQDGPCTPDLARAPLRTLAVAGDPITFTLSAALRCPATAVPLDAVLVVDHSDSMGSQSRLTNAVRAAQGFLNAVAPGTRVGLVTFSTDVTAALPLSADFAGVRAALAGLKADGRTAITRALLAAETLLAARRPAALGAIVLLTDGREAAGGVPAMLNTATRIKAAGIRIVTVCAGDCDPELAQVASGPDDALSAPDSAKLVDLFDGLAAELARLLPSAIRIIEGYTPDTEPRYGDTIPLPGVREPAEAVWTFARLPRDRPQLLQVVLEPRTAGVREASRFTRFEYRFGDASGYAYFPSGFLDTLSPTPTAFPTWTPTPTRPPTRPPTVTPEPSATPPRLVTPSGWRVVWLPWAQRP